MNDSSLARCFRRFRGSPRSGLALAVMIAVSTLLGTGSVRAADPAPASANPPDQAADASGRPQGSNYLIGPGDTVQIFVWRNPELSVTVPVRPDGKISTPLVEDMVAVGKTPTQLARDVEQVLAEYVRSPQVNVIVTNPQSAYNQVKVIGQVAQPKSVAYREGMTVLDLMLEVGGLTPFASGNRAKILRRDAHGVQQTIKLKLGDLMKKGRAADNPLLKPGDIVVVPEAIF